MNNFEGLIDTIRDATRQLVSDVEVAWRELKEDLHETVTAKYLRPGGVAYCKSNGKKYYGILTGTEIISLNNENEPEIMDLQAFLDLHNSDKLKVAAAKRIAVGCNEVDFTARMAIEDEKFPSTKAFVMKCLNVRNAKNVDEAINDRFGSYEYLSYDIPDDSDEVEKDDDE